MTGRTSAWTKRRARSQYFRSSALMPAKTEAGSVPRASVRRYSGSTVPAGNSGAGPVTVGAGLGDVVVMSASSGSAAAAGRTGDVAHAASTKNALKRSSTSRNSVSRPCRLSGQGIADRLGDGVLVRRAGEHGDDDGGRLWAAGVGRGVRTEEGWPERFGQGCEFTAKGCRPRPVRLPGFPGGGGRAKPLPEEGVVHGHHRCGEGNGRVLAAAVLGQGVFEVPEEGPLIPVRGYQ